MKPRQDDESPRRSAGRAAHRPRGGLTSDERHRLLCEVAFRHAQANDSDEELFIDWVADELDAEVRQPGQR